MERIAVGKILQGLRKAKGITQEQLSEVLGVSTAAISKWENEQMYPDISYFPILARFFNVSIDCLFGFTNDLSEQEYEDNLNECVELFKTGNYEKGLEKIKYLTYLFPTNDRLRVNLTSAVIPYLALAENQNLRREIALNLVELCQVCVDKELQVQKHFILAHALLVFAPMQLLSSISIMVQPGLAALSRLGELLKLKTEDEVSGDKKTGKIEDITFSDVSFAYTEKPVVQNFNLQAHENDKIVLFGKNGSGKTTIAKLLIGFYKNYTGSIQINGVELRDISVTDLRSRIGIVAQNIFLFSGSLLDNIRYISPESSEQEIMNALEKAGLDISEFAGGLHFIINENGKNLSGGQRQKIALARMIVKNPDVMIFDEATSNLDVATSNLLKQSIRSIFAKKICIIITHDQEMAAVADKVLRLSE